MKLIITRHRVASNRSKMKNLNHDPVTAPTTDGAFLWCPEGRLTYETGIRGFPNVHIRIVSRVKMRASCSTRPSSEQGAGGDGLQTWNTDFTLHLLLWPQIPFLKHLVLWCRTFLLNYRTEIEYSKWLETELKSSCELVLFHHNLSLAEVAMLPD